jgi:DNA-binding MarR family transcriptional regulator
VNIFITQKGMKLLKKIDAVIDDTEKTLTSPLSKHEMDQLLLILSKLKSK